jgi:glycosyltransferase involved in cell wall biosynthesis
MEYGVLNSSHIIAQTQTQSNQLKNNYGRATSAIVKNFHPAPEESVEKKLPNKIVWIANFKKLKQPEIFIKLAQDLTDLENSEFVMIGKTTESRYHVNLLKQIKKIRNLQYLGQLSQAEVNRVLAQAHLLVNTSLWEGFPNTFIQAWMRKVPVVSLHVNPDNIFNDRILGICSGLYDKLKNDIRNLLSDKNLLEYMGECSQSYAFSIHSENNTSEILSIFENCLKHPINEQ